MLVHHAPIIRFTFSYKSMHEHHRRKLPLQVLTSTRIPNKHHSCGIHKIIAWQAWSDSKTVSLQGEGKWLATSSDCREKDRHIQQCTGWQKKEGRQKKTWRSTFKEHLQEMGVSWHGTRRIASDRERWRLPVARCSESNMRT